MQLYLHSPNSPSWHGAQLKIAQGQLYTLPFIKTTLFRYLCALHVTAAEFGLMHGDTRRLFCNIRDALIRYKRPEDQVLKDKSSVSHVITRPADINVS
jgi:hypothetical protein